MKPISSTRKLYANPVHLLRHVHLASESSCCGSTLPAGMGHLTEGHVGAQPINLLFDGGISRYVAQIHRDARDDEQHAIA